jgi:tRNA(Arg) A34 adenosine deaminase TadA
MEAITAAARMGIQIDGTTLYTTTFPCHNCAKHIVASGIKRVVYIEPYPKSLALDLHSDSIALDEVEHEEVRDKVMFEPFVGIAPRRYEDLFSTVTQEGKRLRRKAADGTIRKEPLGIRMQASPLSYIERESAAALLAAKLGNLSI